MRIRTLLGAALLSSLVLTACGGDDSGKAALNADNTTTAAATATTSGSGASGATTTTAKSSGATTTAPTTTKSSSSGSTTGTGFCGDWFLAAAEVGAVSGAANGGKTDAATDLKNLENYFNALAKAAPADIKDDFATYAEFWKKYAAALAKYNNDFTKLLTDPDGQQLLSELSSDKLQKAGDNITAWVEKNCGVGTTTTTK